MRALGIEIVHLMLGKKVYLSGPVRALGIEIDEYCYMLADTTVGACEGPGD